MALVSMTGFGRGEALAGGVKVEVELGSVNRKQFDARVSLPRPLVALEPRVIETLQKRIPRGSVRGTVQVNAMSDSRSRGIAVDMAMAKSYLTQLRAAARELGLEDDLTARSLLALPEVIQYRETSENADTMWPLVRKALGQALDALIGMKRAEGVALQKDLARRTAGLAKRRERLSKLAASVPSTCRRALRKRLADAGVELSVTDPQLVREIAILADKADISEELVRLESHLKQAATLMRSAKPVGRALDFLCQEMFREINTIGSKANHAQISKHVVAFKADLEAVREQVQNVE